MSIVEMESPPEAPTTSGEEPYYEVVGDERVVLSPMSVDAAYLTFEIAFRIAQFARAQGLGHGLSEMLFRIRTDPNLQRRPDAAFVSHERWPKDRRIPKTNAWDVVPELVVEVVSPTNSANEVVKKIGEYFDAGVRLAWVVYPDAAMVYVYTAADKIEVLNRPDTLEGGPVLPGFRLPLAELFAEPEAKP